MAHYITISGCETRTVLNPLNLLIITPDQLRADYLSCYGHATIGTRNIDRLAQEGVRFNNCYCQSPLCAPSRVSFATSTYVGEHGCRNYWSTISPEVPNLATSLKKKGYRTGMFGKNHLFTYDQLDSVWDEIHEVTLGNYDDHPKYANSFSSFEMEKDHVYNKTGELTDDTIDFMRDAKRPFLAWVNYQDPHPAYTCPEPYKSLFDPKEISIPESYYHYHQDKQPYRNKVWRKHSEMDTCTEAELQNAIATYMGQVRYVDDSVGRILTMLDESGLAENTLVLFFSDHGELLGDYKMSHKLPAFYDCLTKIPAIIRHPDKKWAGSVFTGLTEEIDLVPTLLDSLGIDLPATMVGKSWIQSLEQKDYEGKDTVISEAGGGAPTAKTPTPGLRLKAPHLPTSLGPGTMIRKGEWKLSMYVDDRCELYNLSEDPKELVNRYKDPNYSEIRADLTTELLKRIMGVKNRNSGIEWNNDAYPVDVRFEPLLKLKPDETGITGLDD